MCCACSGFALPEQLKQKHRPPPCDLIPGGTLYLASFGKMQSDVYPLHPALMLDWEMPYLSPPCRFGEECVECRGKWPRNTYILAEAVCRSNGPFPTLFAHVSQENTPEGKLVTITKCLKCHTNDLPCDFEEKLITILIKKSGEQIVHLEQVKGKGKATDGENDARTRLRELKKDMAEMRSTNMYLSMCVAEKYHSWHGSPWEDGMTRRAIRAQK